MEIKVGQRVLIDEDNEGIVLAAARVGRYQTEELNWFVKVRLDAWFKKTKWYPAHRIGVIAALVDPVPDTE